MPGGISLHSELVPNEGETRFKSGGKVELRLKVKHGSLQNLCRMGEHPAVHTCTRPNEQLCFQQMVWHPYHTLGKAFSAEHSICTVPEDRSHQVAQDAKLILSNRKLVSALSRPPVTSEAGAHCAAACWQPCAPAGPAHLC